MLGHILSTTGDALRSHTKHAVLKNDHRNQRLRILRKRLEFCINLAHKLLQQKPWQIKSALSLLAKVNTKYSKSPHKLSKQTRKEKGKYSPRISKPIWFHGLFIRSKQSSKQEEA